MKDQIYTLGVWRVKAGREKEFINAWKALGTTFAALPDPPGKGTLLQSVTEPTLFYSFGPWSSLAAVEAMRNDRQAGKGIQELMALCDEAKPGAFRVAAGSP